MHSVIKAFLLVWSLAAFLLSPPAMSQVATHAWSHGYGDTGSDDGHGVAVDNSGNVFVTGTFRGTVDFGAGPLTSAGDHDIFVAKYDPDGGLIWSKRFGNVLKEFVYDIAVDDAGSIFLTGGFSRDLDFGGGPLPCAGVYDVFIAKLGPDGSHVWSRGFGGTYVDYGYGIALTGTGDAVVTGHFSYTADFGGGPLTSAGERDIFVARYDAGGNHVWSKGFGGGGQDWGFGVAVDGDGTVFVTGGFEDTLDFGGGPLTSAGYYDIFVSKFDSNGHHVWSSRFGDTDGDYGRGITVDRTGNVIVTGAFKGVVEFGGEALQSAGEIDIFAVKFSSGGDHVWSKRFGAGGRDLGFSIAASETGNVFMTGYFAGTVDFGGGPLTCSGFYDIFTAIFDRNGNHLWSERFGGTRTDWGYDIAVGTGEDFALTGFFERTADFGGGPFTSAGYSDIFVAMFSGPELTTVALDIQPGSCPNPLNVNVPPKNTNPKKGGVLPVAILGTMDFDVNDVDVSTLLLEGVAPLRHRYRDVAAPVEDGAECECTAAGPDGYEDLVLKFQKSEIVSALGPVSVGDMISLTITGQLNDGTPFEGVDIIRVINKGKK